MLSPAAGAPPALHVDQTAAPANVMSAICISYSNFLSSFNEETAADIASQAVVITSARFGFSSMYFAKSGIETPVDGLEQ
jgi:hypothetical protein